MAFHSEDDFYVTLPSNVSEKDNEEENEEGNNLSNWQTNLASWISLKGNYEVGLAEISFTNSWFNVTKDQDIAILHIPNEKDKGLIGDEKAPKKVYRSRKLQADRFMTIDSLIDAIHRRIHEFPINWKLKPQIIKRRNGIKLLNGLDQSDEMFEVILGEELQGILGIKIKRDYDSEGNPIGNGIITGDAYDITGGLHSIYCYTDIIKHRYVGNSMSQLLRRVDVKTVPFGEQISHIYPNPFYHPVSDQTFGSIEILLKDDSNRLIQFQSGRSIVTLHFRRVKERFIDG